MVEGDCIFLYYYTIFPGIMALNIIQCCLAKWNLKNAKHYFEVFSQYQSEMLVQENIYRSLSLIIGKFLLD